MEKALKKAGFDKYSKNYSAILVVSSSLNLRFLGIPFLQACHFGVMDAFRGGNWTLGIKEPVETSKS